MRSKVEQHTAYEICFQITIATEVTVWSGFYHLRNRDLARGLVACVDGR
jgi:hypothetical protein